MDTSFMLCSPNWRTSPHCPRPGWYSAVLCSPVLILTQLCPRPLVRFPRREWPTCSLSRPEASPAETVPSLCIRLKRRKENSGRPCVGCARRFPRRCQADFRSSPPRLSGSSYESFLTSLCRPHPRRPHPRPRPLRPGEAVTSMVTSSRGSRLLSRRSGDCLCPILPPSACSGTPVIPEWRENSFLNISSPRNKKHFYTHFTNMDNIRLEV